MTRDSERCVTTVTVVPDWDPGNRYEWLVFGQARLRTMTDRRDGRWLLQAHLPKGVTDWEHSSGYAVSLPLIGVMFEAVESHETQIAAWIDPNDVEGFHVPRPGYNPMKHPKATKCDDPECHRGGNHIVLPEGMWYPPNDLELYRAVRGKKVEIRIGVPYDPEDI